MFIAQYIGIMGQNIIELMDTIQYDSGDLSYKFPFLESIEYQRASFSVPKNNIEYIHSTTVIDIPLNNIEYIHSTTVIDIPLNNIEYVPSNTTWSLT